MKNINIKVFTNTNFIGFDNLFIGDEFYSIYLLMLSYSFKATKEGYWIRRKDAHKVAKILKLSYSEVRESMWWYQYNFPEYIEQHQQVYLFRHIPKHEKKPQYYFHIDKLVMRKLFKLYGIDLVMLYSRIIKCKNSKKSFRRRQFMILFDVNEVELNKMLNILEQEYHMKVDRIGHVEEVI